MNNDDNVPDQVVAVTYIFLKNAVDNNEFIHEPEIESTEYGSLSVLWRRDDGGSCLLETLSDNNVSLMMIDKNDKAVSVESPEYDSEFLETISDVLKWEEIDYE